MTIRSLAQQLAQTPQCRALLSLFGDNSVHHALIDGLTASAAPLMLAAVSGQIAHTLLIILRDSEEADYFKQDLTQVLGEERVMIFPSSYKRAAKYGQRDAANEIERTKVLAALSSQLNVAPIIVTSPEALSELVVSQRQLSTTIISLSQGSAADVYELTQQLRSLGFQEVDYVYEPGQFALRGSILDVYSFSCEWPFRIDFFGDEIDTIRTFDVQNQLSREVRQHIDILPHVDSTTTEERVPFFSLLPPDTMTMVHDLQYVINAIQDTYETGFSSQHRAERLENATEMERQEIQRQLDSDNHFIRGTVAADALTQLRTVEWGIDTSKSSLSSNRSADPDAILHFHTEAQPLFHKNIPLLLSTMADYQRQGYKLYVMADSDKQIQRLSEIVKQDEVADIRLIGVDRTLHEGFIDHDRHCCFFTDHQIFDRFHKYQQHSDVARAGKMALTMKELQEMEPGDYVVHVDFGIGRFAGLVRVPSGDSYQEMIRIQYQRGDTVDVSIHSLYKISKYRRSDTGEPPRMSTLGTGAWERMKERAKTRIKDIARDLIRLYARRRHEKGHAFAPDTYMQHELEASFIYEDTPDQLKATQEVKADMESSRPMDRLVCGDVGFGKTEVAVRAACKAAADGKQVAVLVPTTVLAFQHYQTFSERLRDMPVKVEYLTRARSAKQARQIIAELKEGKIDILIGTHKMLGKDVQWHDVGLLIIDEEQKFGVATKEKIRHLRTNIDTLTLSATPIPRTLQFSLMGARDMSIMRTPPPNRYPIYTELTTFHHEVIAEAIGFEMSRNGQVFFVNDRISKLTEIEQLIHRYVPDARVVIGHGQMKPEELERIIMGFINYDYDVLLSTTIIENGIDIPNANTIIINDAHHFGLSDLHQMRGRVGRSNRKAFCYLLAPPKKLLREDARRRLEALENFSELGSGFSLAMQDLDIRGAGNLLGAEQSGFMEDLGYETYQKILTQAVTELKNEEFADFYREEMKQGRKVKANEFVDDCTVESDLEMFFPDSYVPGSSERMLLYRELDNIETDSELEAYQKRLEDRFGPVPRQGMELMQVVALRRLGRQLGCEKMILKNSRMQMQFVSNPDSPFYQSDSFELVLQYITRHTKRCNLKEVNGHRAMVVSGISSVGEAVFTLRQMIEGK